MRNHLMLVAVALAPVSACVDEEPTSSESQEILNGYVVPIGGHEAVVIVERNIGRVCSGTMISPSAVLSAAHCLCGENPYPCELDLPYSVVFTDVLPASGGARRNIEVEATSLHVHPDYDDAYHNDYLVLRFDHPAPPSGSGDLIELTERVQVEPLSIATTQYPAGTAASLVGYGGDGTEADCEAGNNGGVKRQGGTNIDDYYDLGPADGAYLLFEDPSPVHACAGDSGGPALVNNLVAGVSSTGDFGEHSRYDDTSVAHDWIGMVSAPLFDRTDPDAGFCTSIHKCDTGEGDCDWDYQCKSGLVCAYDAGNRSDLASNWDVCWDPDDLVTAYAGDFFDAALPHQDFPPGTWPTTELTVVGDNTISSLSVAPGLTARLCDGSTGGEPCHDYTTNVYSLPKTFGNRASWIRVYPGARLYADTYAGSAQTFKEGTYTSSQMNVVGDNQASSIIVTPGAIVRLCQSASGTGVCHDYWKRQMLGTDMYDLASWIRVDLGVVAYSGRDFTGYNDQGFGVGTWTSSSFTYVGDDAISSLIVAPGRWATLCVGPGGEPPCVDYGPGWYSYVDLDLEDRVSWIQVRTTQFPL